MPYVGFGQRERFLRALAEVEAAADLVGLKRALEGLVEAYGLRHAAFVAFGRPSATVERNTALFTYPAAWVERYLQRRYHEIDPVMRAGLRGILPIDWAAIDKTSPAVRRFFDEAEEAGVGPQGLTLPSHGPNGSRALLSVTCDVSDRDWRAYRPDLVRDMQVIANQAHAKVAALDYAAGGGALPRLSARERESLQWAAAGRTIDQTAKLLDLSPSAVRTYLDGARRKLNCLTKPQAVAVAVGLGLIEG